MSHASTIELIVAALPHPDQIRNIDLGIAKDIRFDWRGVRWCVSTEGLDVEEVKGGMLCGSVGAMLMRELLRRERDRREMDKHAHS